MLAATQSLDLKAHHYRKLDRSNNSQQMLPQRHAFKNTFHFTRTTDPKEKGFFHRNPNQPDEQPVMKEWNEGKVSNSSLEERSPLSLA
ncbi:hypothetical protein AVEN_49704-1, partial [Araneus ventricosus]